jgi:hypothetical protein
MFRRLCTVALLVAAAGCQQAPPPSAPTGAVPTPDSTPGTASTAPAVVAKAPPRVAVPSVDFPPGPLYYCDSASGRKAIAYEPRVEQLCRRHPEMGPCQYERDQCRAGGGRVFTARNEEVTAAVEAEYDRIVRRVRFQGDSGKK